MKPYYFELIRLKKLEEYCKLKCVNIIYEQSSIDDKSKLSFLRGKYKGYLYSRKLISALIKRKKGIMNFELYNHLKFYKSWRAKSRGEEIAIYDLLNLLANSN